MEWLKQCSNDFETLFPDMWIRKLVTDEEKVAAFIEIINFYQSSYLLLSKSILSGEHVYNEGFDDVLEKFITKTTPIEYSESSDLTKLFGQLLCHLHNSLNQYYQLIRTTRVNFDESSDTVILFDSQKMSNAENNSYYQQTLFYLVKYIIPICALEYRFFKDETEYLNFIHLRCELKEDIDSVSSIAVKSILDVVMDKCNFILAKTKKGPTNFYFNSVLNSIDHQKEIVNENLQHFLDYERDSILPHKIYHQLVEDSQSTTPKLTSFIRLARHYKEEPRISHLMKLNDLIYLFSSVYCRINEQKGNTLQSKYDFFSWKTARNYLYNCRFSFLTKQDGFSFDELKQKLIDIESIQMYGIKNFHPHEKTIEYLQKNIANRFDSQDLVNDEDVRNVEDMIAYLKTSVDNYSEALDWSVNHKAIPFLLPYEESLIAYIIKEVDDSEKEFKVFYPSTFARVIDYVKKRKNIQKFDIDYNTLKGRFNIQKDIQKDKKAIEHVKAETENVKTEIKESQKKNIEVLAILAGAITFLFGTAVELFTKNDNQSFLESIVNFQVIGIIILLFVLATLVVSPFFLSGKYSGQDWWRLPSLAFLIFLLGGIILYKQNAQDAVIQSDYKHKTDSLKIEVAKKDAMIAKRDSLNVKFDVNLNLPLK